MICGQLFLFRIKHMASMDVSNHTCIGCHEKVLDPAADVVKSPEGEVRGLHTFTEVKNLSCIMCHKNTGHDIYQ